MQLNYRMWMAYAEQYYPKAVDLNSSIERLKSTLTDMAFDVEHGAVYMKSGYPNLQEAIAMTEKYGIQVELCDKFLKKLITLEAFCRILRNKNFKDIISEIIDFLPYGLVIENKLVECINDEI